MKSGVGWCNKKVDVERERFRQPMMIGMSKELIKRENMVEVNFKVCWSVEHGLNAIIVVPTRHMKIEINN